MRLPPPTSVSTRLGPMACVLDGMGAPVLAIHGGMGGCDQSWILGKALFADSARIIAVARPGYAGTALGLGATPPEQADAFAALLDALGIRKVLVAAISAGGLSAIHFALRHPERCRGLILVSAATGPLHIPPAMKRRLRLLGMLTQIPGALAYLRWKVMKNPAAAAARGVQDPARAAAMLAHPVAGALLRIFQRSLFERTKARISGTRNDMDALSGLQPLPLHQVTVPVLALHGADDRVVPARHSETLALQCANATFVPMAKGEHEVIFTHLDALRDAVAAFASRHDGA